MYLVSGCRVYGGHNAHHRVGGPGDDEGHHVDQRHLQGLHHRLLGPVHPARALAGLVPPVVSCVAIPILIIMKVADFPILLVQSFILILRSRQFSW